jgi:ParB family chromosome partitioning protein
VSKRKALGRGLSALLPETQKEPGTRPPKGFVEVAVDRLSAGPNQPRQDFSQEGLEQLAESIRQQGVLQPLLVRRTDSKSEYLIIAGERRWRAAKLAGLKTVPVAVKEATEAQAFEMALVENLQRLDLNPVEEAQAFHRLIHEYGCTQEEVANRVGRDRSTVANSLRLLSLPKSVQSRLTDGSLTAGHARALLALKSRAQMEFICKKILKEGLSVRQAEALVKLTLAAAPEKKAKSKPRPVGTAVQQLQERLQRALGTRVHIRDKGRGRGRVEIEYHSLDELDRLLDILLR